MTGLFKNNYFLTQRFPNHQYDIIIDFDDYFVYFTWRYGTEGEAVVDEADDMSTGVDSVQQFECVQKAAKNNCCQR